MIYNQNEYLVARQILRRLREERRQNFQNPDPKSREFDAEKPSTYNNEAAIKRLEEIIDYYEKPEDEEYENEKREALNSHGE